MPKLCNIDIDRSQKVYKELAGFIKKLRHRFTIHEIYLYGSFASGDIHEGSDIDLIIIGDFKGKMFQRIEQIISLTDLPIEPLVYTLEEFNRMKRTSSFLKKVIREGKRL
ncbi:MAG: nucleotidyltransferase domain-containing protein [bacterium]